MGLISATISASGQIAAAAINAQAAQEAAQIAADAAKYQADQQMQANREQQAFEEAQADLAFKRNSSAGQLQQLIDAGISEQQARQIIASNGSSGEYTPANSVNAMQGVDLAAEGRARAEGLQNAGQAWSQGTQGAVGAFAGAAQQYGDLLLKAYSSDNGDALGNFAAQSAMEFFNKNIKDIDKSKVHSFVDLENWIDSLDPNSEIGKKWKSWTGSKDFKELKDFSPAVAAFNNSIKTIYTNNLTAAEQLDNLRKDTLCKIASESLTKAQEMLTESENEYKKQLTSTEIEHRENVIAQRKVIINQANVLAEQVLGEHYDTLCKKLNYQRVDATQDLLIEADMNRLMTECAVLSANHTLWTNQEYIHNWVSAQMASAEGDYFFRMVHACQDKATYEKLDQNPRFRGFIATFNAFSQCGVVGAVNETVGSIIKLATTKK